MRTFPWRAVVVAVAWGLAGCATSSSQTESPVSSPTTSDGELLTLAEQDRGPVWRDWEPEGGGSATPASFGGAVRAFDYWEVEDPAVIEEVWSALFPVLDGLRARSGSESQRQSVQLLLEAIEPGRAEKSTRMDLTFLVSSRESDQFEGLACRLYRRLSDAEATPIVTVLLLRDPDRASSPGEIWVWGSPGFEEPDSITALFSRDRSEWRQALVSGISFPEAGDRPALKGGESGEVTARLLTDSIWNRFAGDAYLNSPQSGATSERPRPDRVPRALGLPVEDRTVEQVYSDTEFPPRADLEEL